MPQPGKRPRLPGWGRHHPTPAVVDRGRRAGSRVYFTVCHVVASLHLAPRLHALVRPLRLALVATLQATALLTAGAQQATPSASQPSGLPVVPGARVRISATTLVAPLLANYLETRGDTAVFIDAGAGRGIWTFTLDQITKLEQSRGERRFNWKPMAIWAGIGVPIGTLVIWGPTGFTSPSDSSRKYDRTKTAVIGAGVGALVGAAFGSRYTEEHWMSLPLPKRVSFNPFRRGGGFDVGFSFSF